MFSGDMIWWMKLSLLRNNNKTALKILYRKLRRSTKKDLLQLVYLSHSSNS